MHLFILYLYILNTGQWLALLAQSRKIVAFEIAACWGDFVWSLHVLPGLCLNMTVNVACLSVLALHLTGSLSRAYPATGPVMAWIGRSFVTLN